MKREKQINFHKAKLDVARRRITTLGTVFVEIVKCITLLFLKEMFNTINLLLTEDNFLKSWKGS